MRKITIPVLTAFVLVLGACGDDPPAVNKAAIEKSVRELEGNMSKVMAAKDAAGTAANYTADAILMTPGMAAMKGTDGIRAGMTAMLADPNMKLDFSSDRIEVADSGEMAASHGKYTMTATDPVTKKPMTDKGSYVTVFRKQKDGVWKAVMDINTSEVPPAAPPAKKVVARKGKKR